MSLPIAVQVVATDPLLAEGTAGALDIRPELTVVGDDRRPEVVVVLIDDLGPVGIGLVDDTRRRCSGAKIVLVAGSFGPDEVVHAIADGVTGLMLRRDANVESLSRVVTAVASGDCTVPTEVLGRLLEDGAAMDSAADTNGWSAAYLSERERAVLERVAEGQETGEIARELCYSVRTVTSTMHAVTQRFRLRNRAHAVAYVLRAGLL